MLSDVAPGTVSERSFCRRYPPDGCLRRQGRHKPRFAKVCACRRGRVHPVPFGARVHAVRRPTIIKPHLFEASARAAKPVETALIPHRTFARSKCLIRMGSSCREFPAVARRETTASEHLGRTVERPGRARCGTSRVGRHGNGNYPPPPRHQPHKAVCPLRSRRSVRLDDQCGQKRIVCCNRCTQVRICARLEPMLAIQLSRHHCCEGFYLQQRSRIPWACRQLTFRNLLGRNRPGIDDQACGTRLLPILNFAIPG